MASASSGTVSAVVPTHDRPELVRRAVQGIVDQDYDGDIEVLVVFDQSEPHDLDVALRPGRTVRVLVNDARSPGLAGARNTGVLAAVGEWLAFCDDDDMWLPHRLTAQFARLEEFGAPAAAATGILVATETREIERRAPERVLGHQDFVRDRIMEVNPCTLLVRRSDLVELVGLVDEQIPHGYGEDYDFLLRLTEVLPIVCVPDPLVVITYHAGSYYAANWSKMIEGLEYLQAKHPELGTDPVGSARINGQLAIAYGGLRQRGRALALARTALRANPREKRAFVALAIVTGLPAQRVAALVRRLGRGV